MFEEYLLGEKSYVFRTKQERGKHGNDKCSTPNTADEGAQASLNSDKKETCAKAHISVK